MTPDERFEVARILRLRVWGADCLMCARPSGRGARVSAVKNLAFSRDVEEFLRALGKHDVRYLLIGGSAVIYHRRARLTGDVDFLYDHGSDNVVRLWAALSEFWQGRVPGLQSADELRDPDVIVQFGRPPNRIDLIASLPRFRGRRVPDGSLTLSTLSGTGSPARMARRPGRSPGSSHPHPACPQKSPPCG
ncbi:MAG: hypothetical protein IPK26_28135 [Planctomycetes bacterium]|nr:hypothetical protein [Planctomycetota bacterium]